MPHTPIEGLTAPFEQPARRKSSLRIWLADLTYTQQTIAADVIPNAIGGIATFTETLLDLAHPIRLFKYPDRLVEALDAEGPPDVIGFSNYVWNSSLSYGFATAVKNVSPKTVVVFGGPNYPVEAAEREEWMRRWSAVDFAILKEGELAFARLIEALVETDGDIEKIKRRAIPSIHSIAADGTAILTEEIERIRDLTEIPSPYTTGRLDEFFDGVLLPILQTNRGCPFGCTFCVEGVRYYNKIYHSSREKVDAELEYMGHKMHGLRSRGGRNDLFIADSNFGMYPEDLDTCRSLAYTRSQYQWPEYINVATGKNKKERVLEASRIIDGALRLSGSVQSLDKDVLKNIKRDNISADGLMELGLRAAELGANTYSEVILALPGDSKKAHFSTVRTVIEAGFTNIYLFQLMLLPGTEIASVETKQRYGMVSRYRVLPRCYGYFKVLGQEVRTAEIEEICVANNTLSYEDYLACRRMHLIVTIFYNDGIFISLLKLLRGLGISIFRWLEVMQETEPQPGLAALFDQFREATTAELWEDSAALSVFAGEPGNVEKMISGELGNNLLFVHKTLAITHHLEDLAALARSATRRCIEEAGVSDETIMAFVEDALIYHCSRAQNLFFDRGHEPTVTLQFDIPGFEQAPQGEAPAAFRLAEPQRFRFVSDETQRTLIDRYIGIYGLSPVGIGRILSKVYVRKLFRHAVLDDGTSPDLLRGGPSEIQLHAAGLQN